MQKYAPAPILQLYLEVRYLVQRVDIARFFVLYLYGGLYADLDVFPNRDSFPQVSLGLCKMLSRAIGQRPEWEIEVVVARQGNNSLIDIVDNMIVETQKAQGCELYTDKPCRHVYNTTGPLSVQRWLKQSLMESSTYVFAMGPAHPQFACAA